MNSSLPAKAYVRHPERLCGGNRVELLVGGERAYAEMLSAIAGARRSVYLTTYILHSDATGRRFGDALRERARAGLDVRLMFDAVGSYDSVEDEFLDELARDGVRVHIYHPILPARRRLLGKLQDLHARYELARGRKPRPPSPFAPDFWGFHRRNHQKILVVDSALAFTGGMNIGDDYTDRVEQGVRVKGWHDVQVRVEGPAAIALQNAFTGAWNRSGAVPMPGARLPACGIEPVMLEVCANVEWDAKREKFRRVKRTFMSEAYLNAIRVARSRIRIANAYFLPDGKLRQQLADASRRGVRVQVLVPQDSDVRIVYHASRHTYDELLAAGVEIHEYRGRMMHAKAAVIDGAWATVGSFNLDQRSFHHNLEAGVQVVDASFAAQVEAQFERDLEQCERIDLASWRRRSWHARLREELSHLFAWWL